MLILYLVNNSYFVSSVKVSNLHKKTHGVIWIIRWFHRRGCQISWFTLKFTETSHPLDA